MAEMTNIIQAVQARAQNIGAPYAAHIKASILSAWKYVAAQADWWFLRAGEPIPFTIEAGSDLFTVEHSAEIGRPLHVSNEYDRRIMVYKPRADWLRFRSGLSDTSTSSVSVVFTDSGMVSVDGTLRRQFRAFPKAGDAQTAYLHYREAANEANLANAPGEFEMLLVHGALSIMAPPDKIGGEKATTERWIAVTYKEDQQFRQYLADLMFSHSAAEDREPEIVLDSDVEAAIDEINNL